MDGEAGEEEAMEEDEEGRGGTAVDITQVHCTRQRKWAMSGRQVRTVSIG